MREADEDEIAKADGLHSIKLSPTPRALASFRRR